MLEMKRLTSFFIQHNLVDFCFESISTEESISQDLKKPNSNQSHMKVNLNNKGSSVQTEIIVYKLMDFEARFQQSKVRLIEMYLKIYRHMTGKSC
jgi:hypothetical protein